MGQTRQIRQRELLSRAFRNARLPRSPTRTACDLTLTGGQVHDACEAEALIETIPEGASLLGDKGYDSNAIGEAAAARNVRANIPNRSNR